jgi:hypothetical protein
MGKRWWMMQETIRLVGVHNRRYKCLRKSAKWVGIELLTPEIDTEKVLRRRKVYLDVPDCAPQQENKGPRKLTLRKYFLKIN